MATKKLSELNESLASDPTDFVLLMNTESRTAKKISIENLIKIDHSNVLDRYKFSRDSISGFNSSSIQLSTGNMDGDLVYYAPTTITISGADAAEITGQYEFSGINNNNLYWQNSNDLTISRVDTDGHWTINSGINTLYQFSGQECYPKFGNINLLDESGLSVSKSINSRHTKTKEGPIILNSFFGKVDNLFKATPSLSIDLKEYASITYSGSQILHSSAPEDPIAAFIPKTVELGYADNAQAHSPLSFTSSINQNHPLIFEYSLNSFVVNKITEKISGMKGDCSFHQNFSTNIAASLAPTRTGVVVNGPANFSGFKPVTPSFSLDIDGNGGVTYEKDVVLLERYFSGISGAGLVEGLNLSPGINSRTGHQDIANYIQSGIDLSAFDINENGQLDQSDIDLIKFYVVSGGINPSNSIEKNTMTDNQLKENLLKLF
jgi:hypothetical protein